MSEKPADRLAVIRREVLAQFSYLLLGRGVDPASEEVLRLDPNDADRDPAPHYEELSYMFGVPFDDNEFHFGGFGGSLRHTIDFLAAHWDGSLRHGTGGDPPAGRAA